MNDIFKFLKNEKYCITGSSAYELPRYSPADIDICIAARDKDHARAIYQNMDKYLSNDDYLLDEIIEYDAPFDWGGTTFIRCNISHFDIFIVDKYTFATIKFVTNEFKNMPHMTKLLMAKRKRFRVYLFQTYCETYMTMKKWG